MHCPSETHWSVTKRLLWCLKHIIHDGLLLIKHHQPLTLKAFSNVEWASNKDDRTSTTTYIIYLGGIVISWCSHKQKFVVRSSTKVKYHALACMTAQVLGSNFFWVNLVFNFLRHLTTPILHTYLSILTFTLCMNMLQM